MVAKCIDIYKKEDDMYYYKLKYSDEHIESLSLNELKYRICNEQLNVINLVSDYATDAYRYAWTLGEISSYTRLSVDGISEESEKAELKSSVLGTSTWDGVSRIVNADRISRDIVITDKATILQNSTSAQTIMFIGKHYLYNKRTEKNKFGTVHLRCRKAIIKNRCAFGYVAGADGIQIDSNRIMLSHEFIDINTVNEILAILKHLLDNGFEQKASMLIQIDFKKAGVDFEEVYKRTKQIIESRIYNTKSKENYYDSILPYMSLACSMFVSTGYKYEELLELAVVSQEELINSGYRCEDQANEHKELQQLVNRLYGGMRF